MAKICAACGKKLGFFSGAVKCRQCEGWLCKDCAYVAEQSNRCPACGRHNPR
ncbi:MAG: hypothetical protein JSV27_09975 [Candidatus Bathyarchaeota archaeon]|nr:MAG: hypothetical protein JSV27_09975 [Candidatus Bathyarchaeota archaeon]